MRLIGVTSGVSATDRIILSLVLMLDAMLASCLAGLRAERDALARLHPRRLLLTKSIDALESIRAGWADLHVRALAARDAAEAADHARRARGGIASLRQRPRRPSANPRPTSVPAGPVPRDQYARCTT